jgi:hypothetical protein
MLMRARKSALRPMARRLLAFVLALLPFAGSGAVVLASAGHSHGHGGCTDHICACAHRCAPKKKATKRSCHGGEAAPETSMKSRCQHGSEQTTISTTRPHVIPAAAAFGESPVRAQAPPSLAEPLLAGFSRVHLQPPRPRS